MLHSAIKRPEIKYPRATNWCLDAGMILMIGGGIGVAATTLDMTDDVVANIAAGALVVGLILYVIAIHLSKVDVDVEPESTRLNRVK